MVLAAPGCDSQGVPFVPSDNVGGGDAGTDVSGVDIPGNVDAAPGWDWWAGDLLVWRSEPLPIREVFHDIDGVANGAGYEVYVVGFRGAVLRMDSAVGDWIDVSPATTRSIEGVWAAGPEQAWICGEAGLLMRYAAPPGATYPEWTDQTDPLRTETLNGIDGFGPDNVWAVGDGGVVLTNQGDGWEQVPLETLEIPAAMSNDLYAVYLRGPEDVWIAGQGILLWWNGVEWDRRSVASADAFLSVGGAGETIWVGSDAGYLWYYNTEKWQRIYAPVYYDYDAVWVNEDGTAYATGEDPSPQSIIWFGTKEPWDQLEVASPEGMPEQWAVEENSLVTGLWGSSPEDLFACTQQQQVLHYKKHE